MKPTTMSTLNKQPCQVSRIWHESHTYSFNVRFLTQ